MGVNSLTMEFIEREVALFSFLFLLRRQMLEKPTLLINVIDHRLPEPIFREVQFSILLQLPQKRIPVSLQVIQDFILPNILQALWCAVPLKDVQIILSIPNLIVIVKSFSIWIDIVIVKVILVFKLF